MLVMIGVPFEGDKLTFFLIIVVFFDNVYLFRYVANCTNGADITVHAFSQRQQTFSFSACQFSCAGYLFMGEGGGGKGGLPHGSPPPVLLPSRRGEVLSLIPDKD